MKLSKNSKVSHTYSLLYSIHIVMVFLQFILSSGFDGQAKLWELSTGAVGTHVVCSDGEYSSQGTASALTSQISWSGHTTLRLLCLTTLKTMVCLYVCLFVFGWVYFIVGSRHCSPDGG